MAIDAPQGQCVSWNHVVCIPTAKPQRHAVGPLKWYEMVQNGTEIKKSRPAAGFLTCPFNRGRSTALRVPTRWQAEMG